MKSPQELQSQMAEGKLNPIAEVFAILQSFCSLACQFPNWMIIDLLLCVGRNVSFVSTGTFCLWTSSSLKRTMGTELFSFCWWQKISTRSLCVMTGTRLKHYDKLAPELPQGSCLQNAGYQTFWFL